MVDICISLLRLMLQIAVTAKGYKGGAVVRYHQYGPGLNPRRRVICRVSLLSTVVLALRVLPGFLGFTFYTNDKHSKFRFDLTSVHTLYNEMQDRLFSATSLHTNYIICFLKLLETLLHL